MRTLNLDESRALEHVTHVDVGTTRGAKYTLKTYVLAKILTKRKEKEEESISKRRRKESETRETEEKKNEIYFANQSLMMILLQAIETSKSRFSTSFELQDFA